MKAELVAALREARKGAYQGKAHQELLFGGVQVHEVDLGNPIHPIALKRDQLLAVRPVGAATVVRRGIGRGLLSTGKARYIRPS